MAAMHFKPMDSETSTYFSALPLSSLGWNVRWYYGKGSTISRCTLQPDSM